MVEGKEAPAAVLQVVAPKDATSSISSVEDMNTWQMEATEKEEWAVEKAGLGWKRW